MSHREQEELWFYLFIRLFHCARRSCQVEYACFDCEALRGIMIVCSVQHKADLTNRTAMGIREIGKHSLRRRRGGLEQECKQRLRRG